MKGVDKVTTYYVLLAIVFGLPALLLMVMEISHEIDVIRVLFLGLEPIGDSRTLNQLTGSELFERRVADLRAAKAQEEPKPPVTLAA